MGDSPQNGLAILLPAAADVALAVRCPRSSFRHRGKQDVP